MSPDLPTAASGSAITIKLKINYKAVLNFYKLRALAVLKKYLKLNYVRNMRKVVKI